MNIPKQFATHLANNGIGTLGSTLFVGRQPSSPDNCVTVYQTPGNNPDPSLPLAEPSIQIIVRNKRYESGQNTVDSIVSLLHRNNNLELVNSDNYWYYIHLEQEPAPIGRDDNERHEWTINFRCKTRR